MILVAKHQRRVINSEGGFTLVELLVVLAIISLIAALATPNVLGYLDSTKVNTTKTQIRNLESALELYYLDNGSYPSSEIGLSALIRAVPEAPGWNGPYIKGGNTLNDGWGHPFAYELSVGASRASVRSLGRDGKEGGEGLDADLGGW